MQNIVVTKAIDAENSEEFRFVVFDLILVFSGYSLMNKPKGKRKWTVSKHWNFYDKRGSNTPEPVMTDEIRNDAIIEFKRIVDEGVKIKTWDEHRPKS